MFQRRLLVVSHNNVSGIVAGSSPAGTARKRSHQAVLAIDINQLVTTVVDIEISFISSALLCVCTVDMLRRIAFAVGKAPNLFKAEIHLAGISFRLFTLEHAT